MRSLMASDEERMHFNKTGSSHISGYLRREGVISWLSQI